MQPRSSVAGCGVSVVLARRPLKLRRPPPPLTPGTGASNEALVTVSTGGESARSEPCSTSESQIRRDHPLNLSISISGGKETNKDSPSNGERSGNSSSLKSLAGAARELWPGEAALPLLSLSKLTWKGTSERVRAPCATPTGRAASVFSESGCLGMQPKVGGKLHLKLNTGTRPIANKYHEGKVKSTLKRESKRPRNR